MKRIQIIKIGGEILDDVLRLDAFLKELACFSSPFVLVHGGGRKATGLASKLGVPQKMVDGRRITDGETLDIATMVYAGLINKQLVARLQALGTDAIGLSGADMNCIQASIRDKALMDYGFVGDLGSDSVKSSRFQMLLEAGLIPVVCAITHDKNGQLLNTNADTIACAIAIALSLFYEVQLNYCFGKNGVLGNPADEQSLIPHLSQTEYLRLKCTGSIHSGMIPKLDNAFKALQEGVKAVRIGEAGAIRHLVQNNKHYGTELSV
jgi:acetylglutamate kinase